MSKEKLFFTNTCPYSQKVLRFIEKNNILLERAEIANETNKEILVELGGDSQVPALLVDGEIMYESDDIIRYLGKKYDVEVTDEDLQTEASFCPIF